jgi:hypothetical protein
VIFKASTLTVSKCAANFVLDIYDSKGLTTRDADITWSASEINNAQISTDLNTKLTA